MLIHFARQLRRCPSWLLLGMLLPWCLVGCQLSQAVQSPTSAHVQTLSAPSADECHGHSSGQLSLESTQACADCDESPVQLPQALVWLAPLAQTDAIFALLPLAPKTPILAVRGADPPGYPPRYLRLEVFRL